MMLDNNENFGIKVTQDDYPIWEDEYGARYSNDRKKLISIPSKGYGINGVYRIKDGTVVICDGSIGRSISITIPSTVRYIGKDAFNGQNINDVTCESNSFVIENGLLLTRDKTRLIAIVSRKDNIVTIPDETIFIDEHAFFEEYSWSYDHPPYFIRINHKLSSSFRNDFAKIIVPNPIIKHNLIDNGFDDSDFIVDDVFVDEYGVIYSSDKSKLLCYPKELEYTEYCIAEGCKEISADGFNYLPDPDGDGQLFINGNKLETLVFPSTIERIGKNALQGCVKLKSIMCPKQKFYTLQSLLYGYSDYRGSFITFMRRKGISMHPIL